jgi:hypothetical protein
MKLISLACYFLMLIGLTGCEGRQSSIPTSTANPPAATSTFILSATISPTAIIPTPMPPTQTAYPYITPDSIQLEQWKEYERALAQALMPGYAPGKIICEWEILGRSGQELYVWAVCGGAHNSSTVIKTAVIRLRSDGTVEQIEVPGNGSANAPDIRRLFPEYLQQRIFDHAIDLNRLIAHLERRRIHPEEPPLIVLSATVTP